jgi:hypothetical protein
MPHRLLKLLEVNLLETALYVTSWLYLTFSPYDVIEKLLFGLLSGVGIAAGKWVVEAIKKKYGL